MKNRTLIQAFQYVDDRYLDEAELVSVGKSAAPAHSSSRHLLSLAAAAALLLALGTAAYAIGHLSVFQSMKALHAGSEQEAVFEAAEQYAADQKPERMELPSPDLSALEIYERYYDGENLLLGFAIDEVLPGPIIGYKPDTELLSRMKEIPGSYAFTYSDDPDDSLDHELARYSVVDDTIYGISPEEYKEWMSHRTENAKAADLRNMNNLMMDWRLQEKLSPEDYENFWRLLRQNGSACVVFSSLVPGDHIKLDDGTDLGAPGWQDVEGGTCLTISPVSEAAQNRNRLDLRLRLYSYREYWYMELHGHAYIAYERDDGTELHFSVDNAKLAS